MNNKRLTREFTVKLSTGKTMTAEIRAIMTYDPYYGEDLDGNRGVTMSFMEDIEIDGPLLFDDDCRVLTVEESTEARELLLRNAYTYNWEEDD